MVSTQPKPISASSTRPKEAESSEDERNLLSKSLPNSDIQVTDKQLTQKFSTMPRGGALTTAPGDASRSTSRGRAPPAPPKRDPTTTLSISRARARSLTSSGSGTAQNSAQMTRSEIGTSSAASGGANAAEYDSEGRSTKSSSPTTSIESMIVNRNAQNSDKNSNNSNSKIASIR